MGAFSSALTGTTTAARRSPNFGGLPPQDRGGEGLGGFLGNFVGDIGDVVGGLFRFVGTGVAEAITQPTNVVKEFATLGFADTPVNVLTPAVVPHMGAAILADVKDRYLEGDVLQELYDHPLMFLMDVAAGAGAVGAGARAATGTGAVYGRVGRAVLGSEKVARNAELLNQARALRVARASDDAAKQAELMASLGPKANKALMLERLVTHPLAIAEPKSGYTFDVMPTRNPLINAVWSEPVRHKYFLEGVSNFERRVDDLRAAVAETGGDAASTRQLAAMENALGRMKASGATYVAKEKYGTVMARAKLKRSTDSMLGKLQMRGIVDRRDRREALRAIIRRVGVTGETLDRALPYLEGIDDGLPVSMSPEVLSAQLAEKGFDSIEDAADAVVYHDPRADVLDVDERNSLGALVTRGEIEPPIRRTEDGEVIEAPDVLATVQGPPRRRRVVDEVEDLSGYPDGREVRQTISDPGNLRRMAIEAADTVGSRLRSAFGDKSIRLRLKDEAKIRQAMDEGGRVLDALGARVIVDNWRGVNRAVQQIQESGLQIVGVEDLRRVPGSGGMRGTRVYVADEAGLISEVEIGTALFDRFRDATSDHDRMTSRLHRDLRKAQGTQAQIAASNNPNQAGVQQALAEQSKLVEALEADVTAMDRYMEGHYEMLADEIALQHGKAIPDTELRALTNELRLWVARYLEKPLIEDGYFDAIPAFERVYLPAKIKSGAEWSEEADDFLGGESAVALDDARAAAGLPMPVYFPHIESPGDLRDFIAPRRGQGQKKLAMNQNLRRSRGALFEQGTYITDVEEAYSRRAARAIKMRDTYAMIAEVSKRYGRRLESADDLVDGEALIAPEFLQAFVRVAIGIEDRLGALMSKMDDQELYGAVSDLNPEFARQMAPDILAEGIRSVLNIEEREAGALFLAVSAAIPAAQRQLLAVSKRGLELYAVPKVVADRISDSARWNLGPNARIFVDKPTQFWRGLTLYGRPAWVVNNILGNITFSKIGGVRLREVVKAAVDKDYRFYVDELARVYGGGDVEQGWLSSTDFYTPQLGVAEETLAGRAVAKLEAKARSSRLLKVPRKWADVIKQVNTEVENAFRRVGFVEGLRKSDVLRDTHRTARGFWGSKDELQRMLQEGVSPQQAAAAMDKMQTWYGDYASMSPFERQIIRRFVFPFWGFYKHMTKLLVKTPFDYPSKMVVMRSMALVDRDLREEYGAVPEWMEGMVPWGPLGANGLQRFLSVSGPNPFNAYMDVGLGLFHPYIKSTVEMLMGRDAYTLREFTDPDVFTPYGSSQRYRVIRGEGGVPVDAVPIDKVAPSLPVELLSQIPQYDWLRAALAGGKPYDTSGLLESATEGPMVNAAGEPIAPFNAADLAARSLGAGFFEYDIQAFRERQATERESALTQAYERWAEQRVGSAEGVG